MLEFERIDDALSIHGTEVRYVTVSKTGAITGRVIANKNGVSVSGKFPTQLDEEEVKLFQLVLRKASKIYTILLYAGQAYAPDEEKLERILEEERTIVPPYTFGIDRQAIADSDWRERDDEEEIEFPPGFEITDVIIEEELDPFEPDHTLDEYPRVLGDESDGEVDEYLAEL